MGKRYDAEEVSGFMGDLCSAFNGYKAGADEVEAAYNKFVYNDTFKGELADTAKLCIDRHQRNLHKENLVIQNKVLARYKDMKDLFEDIVDKSPKARIDTDVLGEVKKDFQGYRKVVSDHGYTIESIAKYLQDNFSEECDVDFTQPSFQEARDAYTEFSGKNGFIDKTIKKVDEFDDAACDALTHSGVEAYIYDYQQALKQTDLNLLLINPQTPKVENTSLKTLINGTVGAKAMVGAFQNADDTTVTSLYTGDARQDALIKDYLSYNPVTGRYVYEEKIRNFNSLSSDEKKALTHIYKGLSSQYGKYYKDDGEAGKSKEHLERILAGCASDKSKSSAGEYMYSHTAENSYAHSLLRGLKDINGGKSVFAYSNAENIKITLKHERYATVISCNSGTSSNNVIGQNPYMNLGSSVVTSEERTRGYIEDNIKNNPKCYEHQEKLGLDKETLVKILNAAENENDIEVLDNLTKADGDYSKVFTKSASSLSDSAKDTVFTYTASLQSIYASLAEEKNNLVQSEQYKNTPEQYRDKCYGALDEKIKLYKNELVNLSSFYADPQNSYSGGYFESYVDNTKKYMTNEEKIAMYASPDYKMSDEEIAEAKALYKEELGSFQYRGSNQPIFKKPGDEERYNNAVVLKHKCSPVQSAATGAMKTIADIGAFGLDLGVGAANMVSAGIDSVAGTDTKSAMDEFNKAYHQIGDYYMSWFNKDAHSAATQNPIAYVGGSLGSKFLIYQAVSPLFGAVSKGMGITSTAGKFIVNQAGQDALDTALYTYPKYKELTSDGEFSTEDKFAVALDVGVNSLVNLAFGGIEVGVGKVSEKKLVDSFRSAEDLDEFCKGLKEKDLQTLIKNLDPDEAEKLIRGINDSTVKAKATGLYKLKDGAKAIKGVEAVNKIDTGDLKVLEIKDAETANKEWFARGYDKPPYNTDFEVKIIEAGKEKYVRVYSYKPNGTSNKYGGWIMRQSDIEGLTAAQIRDKYALPVEPTHICDVNLQTDFELETGIANSVDGWGNGGGQQFDTMGKMIDKQAFVNERIIGN